MRKTLFLGFLSFLLLAACSSAQGEPGESVRCVLNFDEGWKFCLGAEGECQQPDFDDSGWRTLNLPHDWAIEGDFSKENPSGTGGGALPGGLGWYRKSFTLDKSDEQKRIVVEFGGVYMNSQLFVNGRLVGERPYGYITFEYDITPYIKWGQENVMAVRVDNSRQPNSRWYSGCGIYRSVWLKKLNPLHIAQWGVYVTTPQVSPGEAAVQVAVTLQNEGEAEARYTLTNRIVDADGREVARAQSELALAAGARDEAVLQMSLPSPTLWSVENPYLYTLLTQVSCGGKVVDDKQTPFGLRTIEFDAQRGFSLNGRPLKINGVCNHHDLGCLGAAVNRRAIERQLQILRDMGCNAIRTSHNPPAEELLQLCDQMGFLVMDEAFDMWRRRKTRYDYASYFDEWHERDLTDLLLRDRNHPCIILWSIGNEVMEQWSDARSDTLSLEEANMILNFGHSADQLAVDGEMSVNSLLTRKLAAMVHRLDSGRLVTAGCQEPSPNNHLFRSGAIDVIGYNYHNTQALDVPKNFPGKPFIITESVSCLVTRGYYIMPSDSMYLWPIRWDRYFEQPHFSCSSYDNCHAPWGNSHSETLQLVKQNDFISGQFVWTGFDYIGEPTPYGWPARSSYFGIVDLAGFPKDVYYLYQSEWTDKTVLHLFPHWNWQPGDTVDVWAYYSNADEVELYLNGTSQGVRRKEGDALHVCWRLPYQPGTLRAVSRKEGKRVAEQEVVTAGEPAAIRLTPDRSKITADGRDLSFVTVELLDADGNLCPTADNLINFAVEGNATIAGVDNGCQYSMERFKDNKRHAFNGKCLVVLQNNGRRGSACLTATGEGLKPAKVSIEAR